MGKVTTFVCVIALGLILVASGETDDLDENGEDGLSQPFDATESTFIEESISQKTNVPDSEKLGEGTEPPDNENPEGKKRKGNSRSRQKGDCEKGEEGEALADEDCKGTTNKGSSNRRRTKGSKGSRNRGQGGQNRGRGNSTPSPKQNDDNKQGTENKSMGDEDSEGTERSEQPSLSSQRKGDREINEPAKRSSWTDAPFVTLKTSETSEMPGETNAGYTEPNNSVCAYPPDIEGAVTPLLQGNEHPLGTTITYSCPLGYVSRNSINHISVCRIDRDTGKAEWTTPEISCNRTRSCGDPGYLNNGQRKGNLFTFPNKVEYMCDEGYKLRGLSTRYCQAGGEWSGRLPTCELIYCNAPTNPANGRVSYSSLEYGTELKYVCNAGFLLKKHKPRICSEDGSWSNEEPECIEATCDEPQPPKHGSVKLHGELKVGSIATYSCDPDRKLHGATTTKCLISGKWTFDAPDCLTTCTVSFIENGEIGRYETRHTRWSSHEEFKKVAAGNIVNSGETLFFRCKGDFLPLEGSQFVTSNRVEVTCNDGTWSKDLQCKPTRCTGPPPPSKNASPVVNSREHGFSIYYICKFRDVLKIPGNVTCHLGSWIGIPPKCLSKPCFTKDLNYPGLVIPSQEYFESFESFDISCEVGYRKTSRMLIKITCARGSWEISQNPCTKEGEESRLTATTDKWKVTHGEIQPSTNVESSSPRSTAIERECACVYEFADSSVTARKGATKLEAGDTIRLGGNVSFECKPGYLLTWQNGFQFSRKANMTCSTCKEWRRTDIPTCTRATSSTFIHYNGELKILPGGVVEVSKEEILRFLCISTHTYPVWSLGGKQDIVKVHYDNIPEQRITYYISYLDINRATERHAGKYECYLREDDGSHAGITFLYLKVNAGEDRSVSSLGPRVTSSTTEIPTNINLETSTRDASGLIPNKDCSCTYEHEDESVNAQIGNKILKSGAEIKIGEKVSFQCKYARTFLKFQNGLRLQTTANMTCTACKKWKREDVPTCEISEQSDSLIGFEENLNILPGGNTSIQQGVIHRFSCMNDWKQPEWHYGQRKGVFVSKTSVPLSGRLQIYITYLVIQKEETELSGEYECYIHDDQGHRKSTFLHLQVTDYVSVSCPEFSNLSELRVNYSNGVSVGSIATFSCSVTTKAFTGSNNSICQGDGVWSNPLPSCEDSKCSIGDLAETVPENVQPDISEDVEEHVTIGSVVRLKCNDNEVMTGEREAQCGKEGKWKLGSFQCVPGCVLDLDPSSHLVVQPIKDSYRIGEFVLLSCPPGQEMSDKVERLMCFFGGWSDPLPECKEKSGRR